MPELSFLLNADESAAREALARCCGSSRWIDGMLALRPFADDDAVFRAAAEVWGRCEERDVREAFAHHPRIGADMNALRARFRSTSAWAGSEQAAVAEASDDVLTSLRDENEAYEQRFGYIFIVCATGKIAEEMLTILRARMPNPPAEELRVAAAEQAKITQLRLRKLVP